MPALEMFISDFAKRKMKDFGNKVIQSIQESSRRNNPNIRKELNSIKNISRKNIVNRNNRFHTRTKRPQDIEKRRQEILKNKQDRCHLGTFDKEIYQFAKRPNSPTPGTFTIDEFKNSNLFNYSRQISKINTSVINEFDVKNIFSQFSNRRLSDYTIMENLKKGSYSMDIMTKFDITKSKLTRYAAAGYVVYDQVQKEYYLTDVGCFKLDMVMNNKELSAYDANVIMGYIDRNNGHCTPTELKDFIKNDLEGRSYVPMLEYAKERIDKNIKNGFIGTDDFGYYITYSGRQSQIIIKANQDEKLNKRLEYLNKLGFIVYNKDGSISVTDEFYVQLEKKGLFKDISFDKEKEEKFRFNYVDKSLFDIMKVTGTLKIEDIREKFPSEADSKKLETALKRVKILEDNGLIKNTEDGYIKTEFGKNCELQYINKTKEKDIFKLSQIDVDVFKIIDENKGNISHKFLESKFLGEPEKVNAIKERLIVLEWEGYLIRDNNNFIKTKNGAEKIKKFLDNPYSSINFKLSKYDTAIYNSAKDGCIDLNERRIFYKEKFSDNEKEMKRQMTMLTKRLNKLEANGFIELRENDRYYITEKWNTCRDNKDCTENKKEFIFGKYDIKVLNIFSENKLKVDEVINILSTKSNNISAAERDTKIYLGRLKKLELNGYLEFNEQDKIYIKTQKCIEAEKEFSKAKNRIKGNDEIRELAKRYILQDIRIDHINKLHTSNAIPNKTYFNKDFDIIEGINKTLKDKNSELELNTGFGEYAFYKTFDKPIGKDGTGNDLYTLKVILLDDGNVWTAYPNYKIFNKQSTDKELKFTKYDFDNISSVAANGVWTKSNFENKFSKLENEEVQKKLLSVQKRLDNLAEAGFIKKLSDSDYELSNFYIQRCNLTIEKTINRSLSSEQRQVLKDLSCFYNMTDKQIMDYIYNSATNYKDYDLKSLFKKGLVEKSLRDFNGDGQFTTVYYLSTEGKKVVSHLTGTQIKNIDDSKIHYRPEELKHDLLVYTAYKDVEDKLKDQGCSIDNVMTDKDIRKKYSSGSSMFKEYPDLHIEFTDTNTGEKGFINVEVDCGYKDNIIKSKAENISNLMWYTNTAVQAEKIMKCVPNTIPVVIDF